MRAVLLIHWQFAVQQVFFLFGHSLSLLWRHEGRGRDSAFFCCFWWCSDVRKGMWQLYWHCWVLLRILTGQFQQVKHQGRDSQFSGKTEERKLGRLSEMCSWLSDRDLLWEACKHMGNYLVSSIAEIKGRQELKRKDIATNIFSGFQPSVCRIVWALLHSFTIHFKKCWCSRGRNMSNHAI